VKRTDDSRFYVGLLVSRKYIVTVFRAKYKIEIFILKNLIFEKLMHHQIKTSDGNLKNTLVHLGDPKTDTRTVSPVSGVDDDVAVLKACKSERTGRFSLQKTLFANMSGSDRPGTVLFFARNKTLMYFNTTVLSDENCPADITATGSNFRFFPERHVCTQTDTTASCSVQKIRKKRKKSVHENTFFFLGISTLTFKFFKKKKKNALFRLSACCPAR
jgi:hypothetical protein